MAAAAPRVSIILPTYNWSSVLPYSIGSAQAQTLSDFELLVVGDGCTDDSAAAVAAIGDERLRWIGLMQNSGHQATPNNEGLRQARGEIIAYLGHDDLWLPDHLESLVRAIDDGADLSYSIVRWVSPNPRDDPFFLLPEYHPGRFIPPSSVAHRRAVVERIGGWRHYRDVPKTPDTDLWQRAHAAGSRFAFVPRVTVIKLPAALRPDVYRERPFHEQADWLERIRRDPDLGNRELVSALCGHVPPRRMRYRELVGHLWRETWRRLGRRIRRRPVRLDGAAYIDETRRMKGLGALRRDARELAPEAAAPLSGEGA
jgi:glycosyltransferase involved in cell wall biosynthesis